MMFSCGLRRDSNTRRRPALVRTRSQISAPAVFTRYSPYFIAYPSCRDVDTGARRWAGAFVRTVDVGEIIVGRTRHASCTADDYINDTTQKTRSEVWSRSFHVRRSLPSAVSTGRSIRMVENWPLFYRGLTSIRG